MKKFRFHLLGLVHLPTSERYSSCAFTQKNVKLAKMLKSLGHEVILYGSEGSDTDIATSFVQTHTLKDIRDSWGDGDNRFEVGYDWQTYGYRHDFNTEKQMATHKYYQKAIEAIAKNIKDDDFLLVTQGVYQKPITDALQSLYLICEPGIGYRGSYTKFRAFESAYLRNFTYGSEHPGESINGNYYDRVIPNYFDPADFSFKEKKEDYFLFMGRLIARKGVNTAILTAEATKTKLIIAGQKDEDETQFLQLDNKWVEFVGYADKERRRELMAGAKATFVPTIYLEAFGGVAVESLLSGTPIITTDFGVFPEYNLNGITGFRCNTLKEFVEAAKKVIHLSPKVIHNYAVDNFSMENVKFKYQQWFEDLYALYESSVDSSKKGWHRL